MNEEHFLTELKIYLNPLSPEQLEKVLTSFMEVFKEGKAQQLSEEEIAKSLGKPKEIAGEILQSYHIKVQEKELYHTDWQEVKPNYQKEAEEDFEANYHKISTDPYKRRKAPLLPRILLLLFNLFIGIWLIFSLYACLAGAWMVVVGFFAAPIISLISFLFLPISVSMFQLSISFILMGVAFFMVVLGRPITKFIHQNIKRYFRFSNRVWKGEY